MSPRTSFIIQIIITVGPLRTAGIFSDFLKKKVYMSRVMRKPTFWFPTWFDTNRAVQPQKMARGLKFRI